MALYCTISVVRRLTGRQSRTVDISPIFFASVVWFIENGNDLVIGIVREFISTVC